MQRLLQTLISNLIHRYRPLSHLPSSLAPSLFLLVSAPRSKKQKKISSICPQPPKHAGGARAVALRARAWERGSGARWVGGLSPPGCPPPGPRGEGGATPPLCRCRGGQGLFPCQMSGRAGPTAKRTFPASRAYCQENVALPNCSGRRGGQGGARQAEEGCQFHHHLPTIEQISNNCQTIAKQLSNNCQKN